jgi:hypothetical protein
MNVKVVQVYWYEVHYPRTGETEVRPVVILEIHDGIPVFATFATLTHSKIKDFDGRYDKWKVPLFKGIEAGLETGSYAKANCVAEADISSFKPKNYIANLNRTDLQN